MTIAVIGAGSWGTALSLILARNGVDVWMVGHDPDEMEALQSRRENMRYLPGFLLPPEIQYATLANAPESADAWVIATPSHAVRAACRSIRQAAPTILIASKGLESGTDKVLSDVAQEELPDSQVGVISGPNLAMELARGVPTAAVMAFADRELALSLARPFLCRSFRVFLGTDVVGIEVAGALKNVLAIAAGMGDGLGFGDNTKGALLARGLQEMTKIGQIFGALPETFFGLAGVGDLFATASSKLSRNYRVGYGLGKGQSIQEVLNEIGQVAEGVATSDCVARLIHRHQVHAPIHECVDAVIRGRLRPMHAVERLMEQQARDEGLVP